MFSSVDFRKKEGTQAVKLVEPNAPIFVTVHEKNNHIAAKMIFS